jgi:hypothetical protein
MLAPSPHHGLGIIVFQGAYLVECQSPQKESNRSPRSESQSSPQFFMLKTVMFVNTLIHRTQHEIWYEKLLVGDHQ